MNLLYCHFLWSGGKWSGFFFCLRTNCYFHWRLSEDNTFAIAIFVWNWSGEELRLGGWDTLVVFMLDLVGIPYWHFLHRWAHQPGNLGLGTGFAKMSLCVSLLFTSIYKTKHWQSFIKKNKILERLQISNINLFGG